MAKKKCPACGYKLEVPNVIITKKLEFPFSWRYCKNCEAITRYKYDRIIGHSACQVCGLRASDNSIQMQQVKIIKGDDEDE